MATHSSILAWKIPWTEEPRRLQSKSWTRLEQHSSSSSKPSRYWSWNSNILGTWCEELTHWKRLWCCERLKAGGDKEDRGWDGWMASPTQWTWVWVSSGSWWWTGKPGVLQSMRSQRVRHDWVTELNWNIPEKNATLLTLWFHLSVAHVRFPTYRIIK